MSESKQMMMLDYKNIHHEIQRLERLVLKHIYDTYLNTIDDDEDQEQDNVQQNKGIETQDVFIQKFTRRYQAPISQEELIKQELYKAEQSNIEYDKYGDEKTIYGYPDALRCQYIIFKGNKLKRCSNKIKEDHFCYSHIGKENPFHKKYQDLIKNFKLNQSKDDENEN